MDGSLHGPKLVYMDDSFHDRSLTSMDGSLHGSGTTYMDAVSTSPSCLNDWNLPCVEASLHGWDSPWIEFAYMDVCSIRQFVFAWTVVSICRLIYMCQTRVLLAVALL
jgi:hypothetical protein